MKVKSHLLLTLAMITTSSAQQITGRIVGTVLDASGAGVPGAEVTAANQNTGISASSKTDAQGNYVFPTLPTGSYTVRIAAQGFRSAVSSDNQIGVAQTARVDFNLEVGSVTESVVVEAVAPLVQSTTSDISQSIETKQVQ